MPLTPKRWFRVSITVPDDLVTTIVELLKFEGRDVIVDEVAAPPSIASALTRAGLQRRRARSLDAALPSSERAKKVAAIIRGLGPGATVTLDELRRHCRDAGYNARSASALATKFKETHVLESTGGRWKVGGASTWGGDARDVAGDLLSHAGPVNGGR
jgi:hypothetical protein